MSVQDALGDAKLVNIDFDKTLTDPDEDEWAEAFSRKPNDDVIEAVREAYFSGYAIIVWTARQWFEAPQIVGWLHAHEVPFHGIRCGKGGSDAYVDDKAMTPEEFTGNYTPPETYAESTYSIDKPPEPSVRSGGIRCDVEESDVQDE